MRLQNYLVNDIKKHHCKLTLKEISKITGIQQTRVFRILNGYDMRVSEFEKLSALYTSEDIIPDLFTTYKSLTSVPKTTTEFYIESLKNLVIQETSR